MNILLTAVHDENKNLSISEKELLRWHQRLGHSSFQQVQFLLNQGILARSEDQRRLHRTAAQIRHPPKCAACLFAKQTRRATVQRSSNAVRDHAGILSADQTLPGQRISVDHFVCSTKGRLFSGAGRTNPDHMYCGGCVFVDQSSGFVHTEFQSSLDTHQTLKAKESFELRCLDYGVRPQAYVTDQGAAFTSHDFSRRLADFRQLHHLAGTGGHHQNGVAERAIGTITRIARTMMLHSAIHWPEVADSQLWPMAVKYAIDVYNHVPRVKSGLSPHDEFTRQRWPLSHLHDFHVWGCPAYVLDKRLGDGRKIGRWEPRSGRHKYMGNSVRHASNVPLVLNPNTGRLTSQFHTVFDEWFHTVTSDLE